MSYLKKSIVKFNLTFPKRCRKPTNKILKLIKLVHKKVQFLNFLKSILLIHTQVQITVLLNYITTHRSVHSVLVLVIGFGFVNGRFRGPLKSIIKKK